MSLKGTSRLPVLLIAAAYQAAQRHLGECIRILQSHNAADMQTGALGDVEIMLIGIEFVILDCVSFVRHYLHLFHRLRANFLQAYQSFILAEPESSVSLPVKQAFLSMRQAAEAG